MRPRLGNEGAVLGPVPAGSRHGTPRTARSPLPAPPPQAPGEGLRPRPGRPLHQRRPKAEAKIAGCEQTLEDLRPELGRRLQWDVEHTFPDSRLRAIDAQLADCGNSAHHGLPSAGALLHRAPGADQPAWPDRPIEVNRPPLPGRDLGIDLGLKALLISSGSGLVVGAAHGLAGRRAGRVEGHTVAAVVPFPGSLAAIASGLPFGVLNRGGSVAGSGR